ncbi:General secretion pathway protein E [methanotrophic endosymbiont of Bathymodiolus azoricus (Menez Gwen)]|jgi:type IV pilus assembly protein PilB|nr:General secretion pathway protein E [methanotrophic endosymbiont of Bathymodiolus azoricus (Menez Gwen)]
MTVEDPIEYEITGAAQCEIDTNSEKVTFNSALRSILRHDPDVVMVGEIRDKETAEIAIKAALTGHMVLSTLHTNSAIATITRMVDMGIAAYLVAAALRVVIAQRLLRRLCAYCRIERPLTVMEASIINRADLAGTLIYEPSGCVYCANKGFKGRIGLYELLELRPEWIKAVSEGAREPELLAMMQAAGINSLLEDAVGKMLAGDTSYSEVMQVAASW